MEGTGYMSEEEIAKLMNQILTETLIDSKPQPLVSQLTIPETSGEEENDSEDEVYVESKAEDDILHDDYENMIEQFNKKMTGDDKVVKQKAREIAMIMSFKVWFIEQASKQCMAEIRNNKKRLIKLYEKKFNEQIKSKNDKQK